MSASRRGIGASSKQAIWIPVASGLVAFTLTIGTVAAFGHPLHGSEEEQAPPAASREAESGPESESVAVEVIDEIEEPAYPVVGYVDHSIKWSDETVWQVPVDAPIETFPFDSQPVISDFDSGCTDVQVQWLTEHAVPQQFFAWGDAGNALHLEINNDVYDSTVTLTDIRFDGEEVPSVPMIQFACPFNSIGEAFNQVPQIGVDGKPAVWGPDFGMGMPGGMIAEEMAEGTPLNFGLSPVQTGHLTLLRSKEVDSSKQYAGNIVAAVDGSSAQTVVIGEDAVFWRAPESGYWFGYGPRSYGAIQCHSGKGIPEGALWLDYADAPACSKNEVVAMFEELR